MPDQVDYAALADKARAAAPDYAAMAAQARGADTPYVPDSPLAHPLNEQEPSSMSDALEALRSAAHPKDVGDLLPLISEIGGAKVVGEALAPVARFAAKYGGAGLKLLGEGATSLLPPAAVAPVKAAIATLSELKPSEWNNPLTVAGREGRTTAATRAFNDLPLAEQQKQLPTTAAPIRAVAAPPVSSVNPNDLPLYQQMEQLPVSGPTPVTTRTAPPPYQPSGVVAPAPSVMTDLDLARREVAAGRLSPAVLRGIERAQTVRSAASGAPAAATTAPAAPPAAGAVVPETAAAPVVQPPPVATNAPPAQAPPVTGVAPPVVQPPAAAFSPQRTLNDLALSARRAKTALTGTEYQQGVDLVKQGATVPDALATLIQARQPVDPAAALASTLGTPSDAEVRAALDARYAKGEIKTPSAETAKSVAAGIRDPKTGQFVSETRLKELQQKFGGTQP